MKDTYLQSITKLHSPCPMYKSLTTFIISTILLVLTSPAFTFAKDENNQHQDPQLSISPPQVESTLAELSDEQVRKLLIAELKNKTTHQQADSMSAEGSQGPGAFLGNLLHSLSNETEVSRGRLADLRAAIPNMLPDLYKTFIALCPYGTSHGALVNFLWVLLFVGIGIMVEWFAKKMVINKYFFLNIKSLPYLNTVEKFFAGITKELPDLIGLSLFFVAAYFSFFLYIGTDSPYVQLFFLAILVAISLIKAFTIFSHILFSPNVDSFRILPLTSTVAKMAHTLITLTSGYIISALMFAVIAKKLGAQPSTFLLLQLIFASILLLGTGLGCLFLKTRIKNHILADRSEAPSWGREQLANIWHILALLYLSILWLLLLNDIADPGTRNKGAFLLSFFVVPIWMIADMVIQWIVTYFMASLKIYSATPVEAMDEEDREHYLKGKALYYKIRSFSRFGLIIALLIWVAGLWNITLPFVSNLAAVILDTLIILTISLFFWQFLSTWIEKKIKESLPEEEEEEEETDSEWGSAANRGRSYTLLPMIRRFIGTCLVVLVTMTILSSIGVDIGPLLAGAGVIGLAIGFGAQKLVSDMFSGFFYLLDDAFRVGEYLQAGSVSGTVEAISLRNIMLRHHRGMLQIVPHSELGAITNYMRGGIVVKFNLDFPYDADIEKIRKTIKKVGQAMLKHEEYGKDFIRPVKSQGVREITNSVMTIRVKFTAQPGTHFVIRREAFRLITEALHAKGLYYAHKKVIVDLPLPEGTAPKETSPEQLKQLAHAAGAAAEALTENDAVQQPTKDTSDTGPKIPV